MSAPAPVTRRFVTVAAALVFVAFLVLTWIGERDSCLRQTGVRESSQVVAVTAAAARREDAAKAMREGDRALSDYYRLLAGRYDRAAAASAPLKCGGLLPETGADRPSATIPDEPTPARPPERQ